MVEEFNKHQRRIMTNLQPNDNWNNGEWSYLRGDSKSPLILIESSILGKVSMDYITLETTKIESPYLKMSRQ